MTTAPLTLYLISGFLAFIPALIWLAIIFKNTKRKTIQLLIFFGSIFSVVPVFLLQYFLSIFPQFDFLQFLQSNIQNQNINLILLFISVGIVEEIVKQALIRFLDSKYLLIETIGESIKFSLIGALGFSFAENIFYFYTIYTQLGVQQLFVAYLFRSVFTTCAHLIFSGFFGYFYGIAKFTINIVEQSRWTGKKQGFATFISRIFNISRMESYRELTILKGLSIAIILHATFNLLLQFNQIIPVAVFVTIFGLLLVYLLKQKTGRLILVTDTTETRSSSMAKTDEDIVIELMGMWFSSKRYVDVLHICQRLLERDPDNKVVQLFKARALDKMEEKNIYAGILSKMFPPKNNGRKDKTIAEMAKQKKKSEVNAPPPKAYVPPPKETDRKNGKEEERFFNLKL